MKKPAGCIFIMSDVSVYHSMISEINEKNVRLEELTKAAEAASVAKSAFLANMSHEIRTPLNAVIGMTLIARKSAVNEKNLTSITAIETASKHLLGILNDVLDMSKIESGKFELINDRFNLKVVMDEVKEIIRQRCTEKNIKLDASLSEKNDIFVQGDHLRLKQVFINLLGNAVKFTPDNGAINFSMNIIDENEKKMKVHFIVSDNGIGMTEEQLGRLFRTFSQADSTIYNRFGGTGLGLSISQNLVQMMGSQIIVKSKLNEGSSFEFTVDFDKAEESSANEEGILNFIPDLSGKRILLVEDVEINRAILIELLTDTHVKFDEAENGEEAVIIFNKAPHGYYDLIFMDVRMPLLDGYEATRQIRQLKRPDAKTIPIVAMTADAYKEDIDKALASGMNGHLAKPIDISAVMKMLMEKLIYNR
jgi:CheY-like chemotaxis protein/nitrogen-specific signal transduction histidine kinase